MCFRRTAELVQVAGNFVEQTLFGDAFTAPDESGTSVSAAVYSGDVANFIREFYMGYVHLRAAELRR